MLETNQWFCYATDAPVLVSKYKFRDATWNKYTPP